MKDLFKIDIDDNRVFGLDILRAVAIFLVVLSHAVVFLPTNYEKITGYMVFDGITMFFVLSGFLIGTIYIKIIEKNRVTANVLLDFWKRRWFRTLPNYLLILTTVYIIEKLFIKDFNIEVYKYYIFSQNLFYPMPNFFPESWSLAVEEWFYLIMPVIIFLFLVLGFSNKKSILLTSIIIIL